MHMSLVSGLCSYEVAMSVTECNGNQQETILFLVHVKLFGLSWGGGGSVFTDHF